MRDIWRRGIAEAEKRGIVAKVGSPAAIAANKKQEKIRMGMNTNDQDISSIQFLQERDRQKVESKTGSRDPFLKKRIEGWKDEKSLRNKRKMQVALYGNKIGTVV